MSNEIEKVQVSDITCDQLMDEAAEELARITERTEFALAVVVQSVKTQEAIAKGQVLINLKEEVPDGKWLLFLKRDDVNLNPGTVNQFMKAARESEALMAMGACEDNVLNHSYSSLNRLSLLPTESKEAFSERIVSGEKIKESELLDELSKPEVKLLKAREELNRTQSRLFDCKDSFEKIREDVKQDPNRDSTDNEYKQANKNKRLAEKRIETLNEKISLLEQQVTDEKNQKLQVSETLSHQEDQLAITTTKLNAVQEELDKMKFDDEISVGLMVKRTGYNLQNMVPQVLSDVQRFNATKGRFPEELRLHLETMIEQLTNYLNEHYA